MFVLVFFSLSFFSSLTRISLKRCVYVITADVAVHYHKHDKNVNWISFFFFIIMIILRHFHLYRDEEVCMLYYDILLLYVIIMLVLHFITVEVGVYIITNIRNKEKY